MAKYIRTNELMKPLNNLINEIQEVYIIAVFMATSDNYSDEDLVDIDIGMTRIIDAYEKLRKTPKEEVTE